MQMLMAGGMDLIFDEKRPADHHNPYGYYEYEKVRDLADDNIWITSCQGKAIKVLYHLLKFLPVELNYKIIFMQRDLDEILDSQDKMLQSLAKPLSNSDRIKTIFERERFNIQKWLEGQHNMETLYLDYNFVLVKTEKSTKKIEHFLDRKLDIMKMCSVINTTYVQSADS